MAQNLSLFDISGRAMAAQLVRMNTSASNLVNAGTVSGSEANAFRSMKPVFRTVMGEAGRATVQVGLVSRVGGNSALPVDVRIISATHQNIEQAITDGRFREDLFFRLGVVLLHVPTLAERTGDIPQLISHFQRGKDPASICRFDDTAIERLQAHNWPGNVRELRNIVERASVLFYGETIDAFGVDQLLGRTAPRLSNSPRVESSSNVVPIPLFTPAQNCDGPIDLKAQIESMELERIQTALDRADGVISEAARLLTLKRTTLIEKMRKYGVDRMAAQ